MVKTLPTSTAGGTDSITGWETKILQATLCSQEKKSGVGGGERKKMYYLVSDSDSGDFPGGPVVKNLPANTGDAG